jgi:hypothetical protein
MSRVCKAKKCPPIDCFQSRVAKIEKLVSSSGPSCRSSETARNRQKSDYPFAFLGLMTMARSDHPRAEKNECTSEKIQLENEMKGMKR